MSGQVQVSAVLPAFNEQDNLPRAVPALEQALKAATAAYEILVVDDGSRDGTAGVLQTLQAERPALRVVTHSRNRGYGAALRSGFAAARYEWVFLMDADNQFDPSQVSALLAHADVADIVAGYRAHRRDPLLRRLNAWAFFSLVRVLFGHLVRDVNCAFKLIRADLLHRLDLRSDGALINAELFVLARRGNARIVEVPVRHFPRTAGKQTGADPRVVLRAFRELFAFWREVRARP
jgi:glycosyltransferase involved in cell wall biosynthesis